MSNAAAHKLSSAVAAGKTACPYCHPFEEKWAREDEPCAYISTDGYWHIRSGCESNTEEFTISLLDDARSKSGLRPCDACGARYYVDGLPQTVAATQQPTAQTGATIAPQYTQNVIPELIPASQITVWHTSNGQYYHKASKCGSMSNAREYTLAEAVANGKKACPYCHPVEEAWADEEGLVVYAGSDKVWHADTACSLLTDEWSIILHDDAVTDRSMTACDECGAHYHASGAVTGGIAANAPGLSGVQPDDTAIEDGLNLNDVTNGDVLVYYSDNTSHYHRRERCSSSTTSAFVPHKLMDALLEGKMACPVCEPPQPETK